MAKPQLQDRFLSIIRQLIQLSPHIISSPVTIGLKKACCHCVYRANHHRWKRDPKGAFRASAMWQSNTFATCGPKL